MENLPQQIKKDSIQKIIDTANQMLNDEINLVEGSRIINSLKQHTDYAGSDIFDIFTLVVSDTDDIPLREDIRKNYSEEYLEKADKKLEGYLADMKASILTACRKVIDLLYSTRN